MGDATCRLRIVAPYGDLIPPAGARSQLSARLTLTEFYEIHVVPTILGPAGASMRTLAEYQQSLRYWRRFTGDPEIGRIDARTCAAYVAGLAGLSGRDGPLARATIRKHCRAIQYLLDRCGPPDRTHRDAAGLIEQVPYLHMPKPDRPLPRPAWRLEEIARLVGAADRMPESVMTWPVPARRWWRCLFLVGYNTGARIGTLLALQWEWVDGSWALVPPAGAKGRRGQRLYLNRHALAALDSLPRDGARVFPWGGGTHALHVQRRMLERLAGVRPLGFHALRRAFASCAAKLNPLAAQVQLGHVGPGLTVVAYHYLDHAALLATLEDLPQPPALE